jgi:hypothetical protein
MCGDLIPHRQIGVLLTKDDLKTATKTGRTQKIPLHRKSHIDRFHLNEHILNREFHDCVSSIEIPPNIKAGSFIKKVESSSLKKKTVSYETVTMVAIRTFYLSLF